MKKIKTVIKEVSASTDVVAMKEREAAFKATMRNLNPFEFDENENVIMCSGSIDLSLCYVDMRYQGYRKHKHIKNLFDKWNLLKLTPIIVVPHPEENRFAIVDGQGRFIVAPQKGKESLNAIVLMGAPEDPDERLKFEAEYFIGQNTETEKLQLIEKHLSKVLIGDPTACGIELMRKTYEFDIVSMSGSRDAQTLGSYPETYDICKTHGVECLDYIFGTCKKAGFNRKSNGYSVYVMRALKDIWKFYPSERETTKEFLSSYLKNINPIDLKNESKIKYPLLDHKVACQLYIEDLVVSNLNLEQKRKDDNGKIININIA